MSGATAQRDVGGQREDVGSEPVYRLPRARPARERTTAESIHAESMAATSREAAHEERHETDRQVIAQMRADGLLHEEHAMHLREALRSSRTIGAAIGIVMVDRNVGEDEAFAVLSRASQDTNRKLSAIAYELVAQRTSRHLPGA